MVSVSRKSSWLMPLVGLGLIMAAWASLSWRAASLRRASPPVGSRGQTIPDAAELTAACRRSARWFLGRLGPECRVIVRVPLVIGGNLPEAELDRWSRRTIAPAAGAMAADYFTTPPNEPITILLFCSRQSYDHYAKKLFAEEPPSACGYYRPHLRTLIVNASSGQAALLHELTHALVAFDFPDVPDWFGEGLASLHEECRIRDAVPAIEGLPGRRLPILQRAIRLGQLRSLESLIRADDFHDRREELNYAQARYFCLYMQHHGLLREFYRRFRGDRQGDPSGCKTVAGLFADRPGETLDTDFRRWVMELQ